MDFTNRRMLEKAQEFANAKSDCEKVKVGAVVVDSSGMALYGANRVMNGGAGCDWDTDNCNCNKILPEDGLPHCVSTIHAEIDAIIRAASKRSLYRAVIYVTRYPCEACARAIVVAGIRTVVYGRPQPISKEVENILAAAGITVEHVPDFEE